MLLDLFLRQVEPLAQKPDGDSETTRLVVADGQETRDVGFSRHGTAAVSPQPQDPPQAHKKQTEAGTKAPASLELLPVVLATDAVLFYARALRRSSTPPTPATSSAKVLGSGTALSVVLNTSCFSEAAPVQPEKP